MTELTELRISLVAQRVKHLSTMWETWIQSLGWDDSLEKEMATPSSIPVVFLWYSAGKESTCNVGDLGSIPGLGKSPGEGKIPFQYPGLENSVDCIVRGVSKSWTRLNDFHFTSLHFQYSCLENPMNRGPWWDTDHGVAKSYIRLR